MDFDLQKFMKSKPREYSSEFFTYISNTFNLTFLEVQEYLTFNFVNMLTKNTMKLKYDEADSK